MNRNQAKELSLLIFSWAVSFFSCHAALDLQATRQNCQAEWLIVGAGPAGIAVVGVLLDIGVEPCQIIWLDQEFNVGRLGAYYTHVPANNKTKEFIQFINSCASFQECSCPAIVALNSANPETYQELAIIVEPLKCITQHLCTKVTAIKGQMTGLCFDGANWCVATDTGSAFTAAHVVLATGSRPKKLEYQTQEIIPLDVALDPQNLQELIRPEDTVAVVGSAHSAILLLKFLSEIPVKHIYNFYQHPISYAVNIDGWVLNAANGLKGVTAEWALNVLEKNPPINLTRIKSTPDILENMLPLCTKTIYAIGFEQTPLPPINGIAPITEHNATNGFIAPRLFGIGIAFPEVIINQLGNEQYKVGLDSFMNYAQRIVPQWVHNELYKQKLEQQTRAQAAKLAQLSDLFEIWAL